MLTPNRRSDPRFAASLRKSAALREERTPPPALSPFTTAAELDSRFAASLRSSAGLRNSVQQSLMRRTPSMPDLPSPSSTREFLARTSKDAKSMRYSYDGAEDMALLTAIEREQARTWQREESRRQREMAMISFLEQSETRQVWHAFSAL